MEHFESCFGPPPHELVGVHFRTAGIGIIEVPPRQAMDSPDTAGNQFLDALVQLVDLITRHRHDDRPLPAASRGYHHQACRKSTINRQRPMCLRAHSNR